MRGLPLVLFVILMAPCVAATWSAGQIDLLDARDAQAFGDEFAYRSGSERAQGGDGAVEIEAQQIIASQYTSTNGLLVGSDFLNSHGDDKVVTNKTWNNARLDGVINRDQYRLDVVGTGTLHLNAPRLKVSQHDTQTIKEDVTFSRAGTDYTWNVSHLHALSGTTSSFTLTGDFLVSFWEWDVQISNSTEGQGYWTGLRNYDNTIPEIASDEYQDQRLYVHVTNGTIRLPTLRLVTTDIFANVTHLDASTAGIHATDGSKTNLSGPVHLALEPHDRDGFMTKIVFESTIPPKPAEPAPAAAPEPTTSLAAPPSDTTALSAGLLGSLLLLALAVVLGRVSRVVLLRRAMTEGDYERVAAGAGMEASRRFGPEVVVARTVSLVKTRDYAGASSFLTQHGNRIAPAVRSYLWACVHAGQGDLEEARSAAIRSILTDPAMASEVGANRALRGFLTEMEAEGYS